MTGAATAAAVAVGMVSLAPTAQGQDSPEPAAHSNARVHRDAGEPLSAKSNETPAARVKAYLRDAGLSEATVGSLVGVGGVWKSRGVAHLRMEQRVAGLRVHDTYARAAFDKSGRLVDLVENVAPVPQGAPHAAAIDEAGALRAAVGDLYPGRSVDARIVGRSKNTTRFAKDGWYAEPTVERVALPTTEGGLAVGYSVTTWTADDNELVESVVSGDGEVVDTIRRTAEEGDGYNIFPIAPSGEDTDGDNQDDAQTTVDGDAVWTYDDVTQLSQYIRGDNVSAYIDRDADNKPDGGGTTVAPGTDGFFDFLSPFDSGSDPESESNRNASVQNLFYLNNVIHDTLYAAGFDEAAGNFQETNPARVGRGGDSVNAESQDGSGTDNANFATPRDGQNPRMQMYLWHGVGTHEVVVGNQVFAAAGAEWGPQLDTSGTTAALAVANDGAGTLTDACEPLVGNYAGKIVLADRGTCTFIVKATNIEQAGAAGVIIANNVAGVPFAMPADTTNPGIPGVMVSRADGDALKGLVAQQTTLRLAEVQPLMRDSSFDSDIVWHEYGHGLTWRMIGRMDGPLAGAIGEGMSDVLALIANNDPVVGEYSASDPIGIRSAPYDEYTRTYGDIVGEGVHKDGEVYGAIGWQMIQNYSAAGQRDQLLADLVDGMNYTPAKPTYEQMRDGIVAGLTNSGGEARVCMVQDAFAKYGVGVGAKGTARGSSVSITQSFKSACGTVFPDPSPTTP